MALGPVLRYELITTSRRARYYVARVAYGLFLLYALYSEYRQSFALRETSNLLRRHRRLTTSGETIKVMSQFAEAAFMAFAWSQWVTVLVVVPALVSGVIADAHRRKTLRDLLSSGLSARSIVLGKLGARLVHVAAFAVLGLPVVALVGLFGGLDPWWVFYAFAGTASMAVGLGGVSVLTSTVSPRPREAILMAYLLEGIWLLVPSLLKPIVRYLTWPFYLLEPLNDLFLASNPLVVWSGWSGIRDAAIYGIPGAWLIRRSSELQRDFLIMAGLQTVFGLLCVWLAVALLRPLRSGDGGLSRAAVLDRVRRRLGRAPVPTVVRPRPWWRSAPTRVACGDDPMWWKERYASSRGGLAWAVSRPFVLFLGTLLGCYLFDVARPALVHVVSFGLHAVSENDLTALNQSARLTAACLFVFWVLAAASAGAVSLISEREDDTWTSLTATLLTGPEVVRAKLFGALWATRRLALAVLAVIAVGLLGGAVHPLGAILAILGMAASGGFAAALGVYVSLRARNSTRALVSTVVLLFLINLAVLYVPAGLFAHSDPPEELAAASMPVLEWVSLLSYDDARAVWDGRRFRVEGYHFRSGPLVVVTIVAGLTVYGLSALAMTVAAGRAFDGVAGRAVRTSRAPDLVFPFKFKASGRV